MEGIRLHADHPYRPVNWRWLRARELRAAGAKPLRRSDDNLIATALRFQIDLAGCRNPADRRRLFDRSRQVYLAYELYDEDEFAVAGRPGRAHPARYEIEARLLARQPRHEIADRLAVPEGAIVYYERLFFNVSDRLRNVGYVIHSVIGPAVHRGLSDREFDVLWKLFGYMWGKAAVDELATTFEGGLPRKLTHAMLTAAWSDDARRTVRRKSALAARALAINSYTQLQLLEVHARFAEVEQKTGDTAGVAGDYLANIASMLSGARWGVGAEGASGVDDRILQHYDGTSGVEPRAEQLDLLARGEPVEVERMTFPELPAERRRQLEAQLGGARQAQEVPAPARVEVRPPAGFTINGSGQEAGTDEAA